MVFKTSLVALETIVNWRLWDSNYRELRSNYKVRDEGIEHFDYSMKILAMKGKEDPLRA